MQQHSSWISFEAHQHLATSSEGYLHFTVTAVRLKAITDYINCRYNARIIALLNDEHLLEEGYAKWF